MFGRGRLRGGFAVAVLALAPARSGWSQDASKPVELIDTPKPLSIGTADATPLEMEATRQRLRSTERQKQLVVDTGKLLALANELKAAVDKSNKDTMSLDVIRKADEIEKLAHTVKDRMKGS